MKRKAGKVQVSERALFARINRKIYEDDEVLRRCRENTRGHPELGDYYLLNWRINGITGKNVDLESYGRKVGVLADYEELES